MSDLEKTYSTKDITIKWQPSKCIHSTICWKGENGLSEVFNPRERPWIKPEGASTERIVEQIRKCPSGALSFTYNTATQNNETENDSVVCSIAVQKNGPLLVKGTIEVTDAEGNATKRENITAFCRCGQSSNKPYCDGQHKHSGFIG